jgi:hypothetical protein
MKNRNVVSLIFLVTLLAACAPSAETPPAVPTNTPIPEKGNADVLFVRAEQAEDGSWTFEVTVSHPDTGWDDYADGWDVVLQNGTVAKTAAGGPFTRLLTHPHENEQPFTRSQSGIIIPEGVNQVTVRAHDLVDGFGGQEVAVYLDQANGESFEVSTPVEASQIPFTLGLTYLQPDGNRYLPNKISLAQTTPLEVSLPGIPVWIVGIAEGNHLRWLAATDDGKLHLIEINKGIVTTNALNATLPEGMPPILTTVAYGDILNHHATETTDTHPVLTETGVLAYLNSDREMVLIREGNQSKVEINALPDGRILSSGSGLFLILTDPTDEYTHAVLGDGLEANSATIINESGEVVGKIMAPADMVFEVIMPIWADINQDGIREVIITASNAEIGAQVIVYQPDGTLIARSDPIGTGYRWRNQAAVAPFGPNGELELVNVITPHLVGRVEFLQLNGDRLERVAQISGYTSHVIGTRNLDMILSGDLDGDGQAEVLLPTQDLKALGIIKRTQTGAEVIAELPLDGSLSTNMAGIDTADGLAIAAGTENGTLYFWLP